MDVQERAREVEQGYAMEALGLRLLKEVTRTEWVVIGQQIRARVEGSAWALGDWLIEGGRDDRNWYGGSTYEKAAQITGYGLVLMCSMTSSADHFFRTAWSSTSLRSSCGSRSVSRCTLNDSVGRRRSRGNAVAVRNAFDRCAPRLGITVVRTQELAEILECLRGNKRMAKAQMQETA